MVGQQVDAHAVRGRLGRVASVELGQQLGARRRRRSTHDQVRGDGQQQLERRGALAGLVADRLRVRRRSPAAC